MPLVVDPTHHDDGQKVAAGRDKDVARNSLALARALVDALNARPRQPYTIEVNGIVDPNTFFDFIKEHRGQVTFVSFELIAPNMFGIRSDLDQEMRELRDQENVQKTTLALQSERGLNLETERIEATARYASEGGGNIHASTKQGKRFSSKKNGQVFNVEGVEDPMLEPASRLRRIIEAIFAP